MSSLLARARQLITLVVVVFLTAAFVHPSLKASLSLQQVHDDDDHDDDESDNQAEKQLEALSSWLLRSRQDLAPTDTIAARHPHPRHPSGLSLRSAGDRSLLRPRLLMRLQI